MLQLAFLENYFFHFKIGGKINDCFSTQLQILFHKNTQVFKFSEKEQRF